MEKKEVKKTTNKDIINKEKVKNEVIVEEVEEKESFNENEAFVKKKKYSDLLLILALVIVVVLGFFLIKTEKPAYEIPLTLSGNAGLHELSYKEYKEKIDNNDEFVIILERATCSHCVTYMPIAEKFATDYNVPMYYVDTDTFSSEEWGEFEKSNSYLRRANGNWGTPTTVVLAGSTAVTYIEGVSTINNLVKLYNENFDARLEPSKEE